MKINKEISKTGEQIRSFNVNAIPAESASNSEAVTVRRKILADALRNGDSAFVKSNGEITVFESTNNSISELDIISELGDEAGLLCAFIRSFYDVLVRVADNSTEYLKSHRNTRIMIPSCSADVYWQGFHALIDDKFTFAVENMNEHERMEFLRKFSALLKETHAEISSLSHKIHDFLVSCDKQNQNGRKEKLNVHP